jgi:hypothetical protein
MNPFKIYIHDTIPPKKKAFIGIVHDAFFNA